MLRRCFSCGSARLGVWIAGAFSPQRTQRKPTRKNEPTVANAVLPLCPPWLMFLAIFLLKLFHKLNQRFAAGARKGVVDRRANAAHRAMTFQAVHTCGRRFGREFLFQVF